jgi:UDP:flavonoid glycosyltransferase YjiC (YdhE family)
VRALFTFVGGTGHLDPLLPFARALRAAGHEVAFAGEEAMAPVLTEWEFHPAGPRTLHAEKTPLIAPDREHELAVIRDTFAGWLAEARVRDLLAVADEWRPDVVISDEVDVAAQVVAERRGVRRASVVVLASGSFVTMDVVGPRLTAMCERWGLASEPVERMLWGDLLLVPVPPSFRDPAHPLPSGAHAVQPGALEGSPRPRGERPLVYATLGTIFDLEAGDLFSRMLAGLSSLPVDVLATVGTRLEPAELGPQRDGVRVERFVPQAEVLPASDVVVCHGGSGSVVGALAWGRPILVLPMGADQLDNAARVEALGVGISLDVMTATPQDIAAAVREILDDHSYERAAKAIAEEARALPPAASVVPLLEGLAAAR